MKERLVGAAVLIAFGVWVIPLVLDGPDPDEAEDAAALALPAASEPAPVRTRTIPLDAPDASVADAVREPAATPDTPVPAAESSRSQGEPAARDETAADAGGQSPPTSAARTAEAAGTNDTAGTDAAADADREAASAPTSTPDPVVAQPPPAESAPTTPLAAAPAAAGDWMVQLGSFGQEENARRLAERIAGYGHTPDISAHRAGGRTMHRVRLGPYETRDRAEAAISSLAAHGFVGQVVVADGATP